MQGTHFSQAPKLLHFHIFKNGGSTLDWILKKNFKKQFAEEHGATSNSTLLTDDISRIIRTRPDVSVFSSHHFRFPIDDLPDVLPLAFVRHPLDRIPSMFEQERRASPETLDDPCYSSLAAWVEHAMEHRTYLVCDSQVSFYARGGIYYEPPTEDCLYDATELIDRLPFVGIVSEYDNSIVLLEFLLRKWWPDFDGSYFIQNASVREPTLEERLARLHRMLGPAIYQRLLLNNRYDLALFEHARHRLHQKLEAMPDFEQRLDCLRSRCQSLR